RCASCFRPPACPTLRSSDLLRTELTNVATSMGLTADDATLLGIMMGEITPPAEDAVGAMGAVDGASGEMAAGMDGATGAVEEQGSEEHTSELQSRFAVVCRL